jgi:hypothetical protein
MNLSKTKRLVNISANILVYAFLALAVISLVLAIFAKSDSDGAVTVFGRQVRIVVSESMEKCDDTDVSAYEIKDIPLKSAVFIECVPKNAEEADAWYEALKVGDVLTFKYLYSTQETITHRIVEKKSNDNGGYTLFLEGDNKNGDVKLLRQTIDTSNGNSFNYVIGKVVSVSYPFGLIVYTLTQPVGIAVLIMLPCFVIILLEVLRIVRYVSEEKKKKAQIVTEAKDNEIEELRAQLEALKKQAAANETQTEAHTENS